MKQGVQEREVPEQNPAASAERSTPAPAPARMAPARRAEASGWTLAKKSSFLELIFNPAA